MDLTIRELNHEDIDVIIKYCHCLSEFELEKIYCELNSNNTAPNHVLDKLDFEPIKQSKKTPNWITFHQKINEYVLNRNKVIKESKMSNCCKQYL
jgi:RimJ/RimL family protein N-acetyltransferase